LEIKDGASMTDASALKWYVVHTYSGFEEKAKLGILERAKMAGMEGKFGDIHIPKVVKESTTKTGKKKLVSRTSFPGYIIVQMSLDDDTLHLVKSTPKITGFVGGAKVPRPLPDHEVLRMIDSEAAPVKKEVDTSVKYNKGDAIKVIDGPFSNFDGVIDEVKPEKAKVRVLVSIFGRETPVELEYSQIKVIGG
jgi:transcription termination/antitermination protein NusG